MSFVSKKLNKNELIEYHKNGWIGPFNLVSKYDSPPLECWCLSSAKFAL